MDYWSKRSVDHFLMAMCSYEEIIIKKEEINQFITTARCTLTVFGSVKAMKNRLKIMDEQDHPYWIGFHELFNVNLMESVDEDQKAPLPVLRKLLCQDETPIANPENTDEKQKVETAELKQEVSGNDQAFPLLEKIRLSLIAVIDQLSRSEYETPVANMDDIELENDVKIAELEPEVAEDPVPVVEVNERIINPDGYFNIKYPPGFRSQNQ